MEICHLLRKSGLLLAAAPQPALEAAGAVFGEGTVTVNCKRPVQGLLGDSKSRNAVNDRGKRTRHRAHEIGIGQHHVTELGGLFLVLYAGALD